MFSKLTADFFTINKKSTVPITHQSLMHQNEYGKKWHHKLKLS